MNKDQLNHNFRVGDIEDNGWNYGISHDLLNKLIEEAKNPHITDLSERRYTGGYVLTYDVCFDCVVPRHRKIEDSSSEEEDSEPD